MFVAFGLQVTVISVEDLSVREGGNDCNPLHVTVRDASVGGDFVHLYSVVVEVRMLHAIQGSSTYFLEFLFLPD